MSDPSTTFLEILLLAALCVFLAFRLRQVLGNYNDEDLTPPPMDLHIQPDMAENQAASSLSAENDEDVAEPGSEQAMSRGLDRIRAADPGFSLDHFLSGARGAFSMIVAAFVGGDTAAFRGLLSDDLYDAFAGEIRTRPDDAPEKQVEIVQYEQVEPVAARLEGSVAEITVLFVTEQRHRQGENPPETRLVRDLWTFRRNTRAQDPNWILTESKPA